VLFKTAVKGEEDFGFISNEIILYSY